MQNRGPSAGTPDGRDLGGDAETRSGSGMACLGPRLGVVGLDMTDSVEKKGSRDTTVQAFAGKRDGTTNILRGPLKNSGDH